MAPDCIWKNLILEIRLHWDFIPWCYPFRLRAKNLLCISLKVTTVKTRLNEIFLFEKCIPRKSGGRCGLKKLNFDGTRVRGMVTIIYCMIMSVYYMIIPEY